MITSDDVCCNIRNVKVIKVMQFKQIFVTAVCVLFLTKNTIIKDIIIRGIEWSLRAFRACEQ